MSVLESVPARTPSAATILIAAATILTAALHLLTAGRYDMMRNELYFLVCGRHPAFGYADQPPLVPLIAAATQLFGPSVWLLRLPASLAAIALVPIAAGFARLLGGSTRAAILAAFAAAAAPALAAIGTLLTTTSFEPIAWTACASCVARAVLRNDRRALLWAGLFAGLSMQAKYGIALWLAPMALGLLATPARRILAWRECWIAVAIAALIAVPSLIWQALHGWPFIEIVVRHTHENISGGPLRFEIGQALSLNVVFAPLWLAGIVAPFWWQTLRPLRFLSIAFIGATALTLVTGGKDYYLFAAYPTMFALGAVACGRLPVWIIGPWIALGCINFLVISPAVLPLLDPPKLFALLQHSHLRPAPDEKAAIGAPLTQVFSDELGWRELEQSVAAIYRALPTDERARAAIVASNYGEAAAIDVYGQKDGLPAAISGEDQYYLWGPRGHDGSVIIHINGDPAHWRAFCDSIVVAGTFGVPLAMPYENGRPIFICRGLRVPLSQAWPRFKRFGQ